LGFCEHGEPHPHVTRSDVSTVQNILSMDSKGLWNQDCTINHVNSGPRLDPWPSPTWSSHTPQMDGMENISRVRKTGTEFDQYLIADKQIEEGILQCMEARWRKGRAVRTDGLVPLRLLSSGSRAVVDIRARDDCLLHQTTLKSSMLPECGARNCGA
jgi:hypothetical protein